MKHALFIVCALAITAPLTGQSGLPLKSLACYSALLCAPALVKHVSPLVNQGYTHLGTGGPWCLGALATTVCYLYQHAQQKPVSMVAAATKLGYLEITAPFANSEQFHRALQKALQDQRIQGLIVKIDGQYGDIALCTTLFHELKKAREQKPVIALIERACLREPYLIACAAQTIIANEQTLIGGIGILSPIVKHKEESNKELYYFYAGKFTPTTDPRSAMTPQESTIIGQLLEARYQQLCTQIAQERKLSLHEQNEWAEGRPFTGKQALERNLIDQIGTLSDAYTTMTKLLEERNIHATDFERINFMDNRNETEK